MNLAYIALFCQTEVEPQMRMHSPRMSPGHPTRPPHQATPPGHPTRPLHQATPPGHPTRPLHQATPPDHPTRPPHQATPPGGWPSGWPGGVVSYIGVESGGWTSSRVPSFCGPPRYRVQFDTNV